MQCLKFGLLQAGANRQIKSQPVLTICSDRPFDLREQKINNLPHLSAHYKIISRRGIFLWLFLSRSVMLVLPFAIIPPGTKAAF